MLFKKKGFEMLGCRKLIKHFGKRQNKMNKQPSGGLYSRRGSRGGETKLLEEQQRPWDDCCPGATAWLLRQPCF